MLALLPAAWFAFALLAALRGPRGSGDWRRAFLGVAVLSGVLVTATAEALGALGLFARGPLALVWAAAAIAAAFVWIAGRRNVARKGSSFAAPRAIAPELPLLAGMALLILIVGVTALVAAPNTWDAMTYHLPRAAHWIQNGSVAHYPTHVLRQLSLSPWAEFAIAHLELLAGSDRLANLVQWLAMGGSAIGVSLIARDLGGGARAQTAAAALALTLPMGILQGSSAQNDHAGAFWLVCFVAFFLPLRKAPSPGALSAWLCAAASLGLALLTKGTSYLYVFPFFLFTALFLAARARRGLAGRILVFAAVALALNLPHFARNVEVFGSLLGSPQGLFNHAFSPGTLISNVLRNAAIHLATPVPAWNGVVEGAVGGIHEVLGVGVGDPATTWLGTEFHVPGRFAGTERPGADETLLLLLHEGFAGNLLHGILILITLVVVAAAPAWRRERDLLVHVWLVAAAFLLFCAALKWQPWHSRLHLPLFLLACPAAAVVLSARPHVAGWACGLLLAASLPWLLANATRPLLGTSSVLRTTRLDQYFFNRPDLKEPFLAAARAVSSERCALGIEIGPDDGEYLLWVALRETGQGKRRIEHVNVSNASGNTTSAPREEPCGLIRLTTGAGGTLVTVAP